jgi:hypothetical protein
MGEREKTTGLGEGIHRDPLGTVQQAATREALQPIEKKNSGPGARGWGARPLRTGRRHSTGQQKEGTGKQNHAGSGGSFECRLSVLIAPVVPAVRPRDISHLRAFGVQLCVSFANYVSDVDREFDSI